MKSNTTSNRQQLVRMTQSVVCAVILLIITAATTGCQKPLFNEKAARNQFDTYDTLRQQNQQLLVPDEFGNPQPALRARLAPQN
jgi:hypothetical protein